MPILPDEYSTLFAQLRPFFSKRVWKLAMVLVIGVILRVLNQAVWETVQVDNWYGQDPTQVEITSDTAVWYHSGMPAVL